MSGVMPHNSFNGDSERGSNDEKFSSQEKGPTALELLTDPDAGVSPEQRAAQV